MDAAGVVVGVVRVVGVMVGVTSVVVVAIVEVVTVAGGGVPGGGFIGVPGMSGVDVLSWTVSQDVEVVEVMLGGGICVQLVVKLVLLLTEGVLEV